MGGGGGERGGRGGEGGWDFIDHSVDDLLGWLTVGGLFEFALEEDWDFRKGWCGGEGGGGVFLLFRGFGHC